MKTFHYLLSGLVQGVAFRHYAVKKAEDLGISGTIRNTSNGDVEVYAQGNENEISQFEYFLHTGPSMARVEKVTREVLEQDEIFRGFDIIW